MHTDNADLRQGIHLMEMMATLLIVNQLMDSLSGTMHTIALMLSLPLLSAVTYTLGRELHNTVYRDQDERIIPLDGPELFGVPAPTVGP